MTLFQQHERFVRQRLERNLFCSGEFVIPVAGKQEFILHDDVDAQVLGVVRQSNQGNVQFSAFQPRKQRCCLLLSQIDRKLGKSLLQRRKDARQDERSDRRDHPEAHFAGHGRASCPGHLHHLFGFPQHRLRPFGNLRSERRNQHAPIGTLRDGGTEHRFQIANTRAERRLGDVATQCRLAEVLRIGKRDQVLELLHRWQSLHRTDPH